MCFFQNLSFWSLMGFLSSILFNLLNLFEFQRIWGWGFVRRAVDNMRWTAGPLVEVPRVGERVYYFPQAHIEQVNEKRLHSLFLTLLTGKNSSPFYLFPLCSQFFFSRNSLWKWWILCWHCSWRTPRIRSWVSRLTFQISFPKFSATLSTFSSG